MSHPQKRRIIQLNKSTPTLSSLSTNGLNDNHTDIDIDIDTRVNKNALVSEVVRELIFSYFEFDEVLSIVPLINKYHAKNIGLIPIKGVATVYGSNLLSKFKILARLRVESLNIPHLNLGWEQSYQVGKLFAELKYLKSVKFTYLRRFGDPLSFYPNKNLTSFETNWCKDLSKLWKFIRRLSKLETLSYFGQPELGEEKLDCSQLPNSLTTLKLSPYAASIVVNAHLIKHVEVHWDVAKESCTFDLDELKCDYKLVLICSDWNSWCKTNRQHLKYNFQQALDFKCSNIEIVEQCLSTSQLIKGPTYYGNSDNRVQLLVDRNQQYKSKSWFKILKRILSEFEFNEASALT